jgi:hypothetical protein
MRKAHLLPLLVLSLATAACWTPDTSDAIVRPNGDSGADSNSGTGGDTFNDTGTGHSDEPDTDDTQDVGPLSCDDDPFPGAVLCISGDRMHDGLGNAVADAGDVNGDGVRDLLVGAAQADTSHSDSGAAYVVLLPRTGTIDAGEADSRLWGAFASDLAAYSLAGLGDENGDGFSDLCIGAIWGGTENQGAAYVVRGPTPKGQSSLLMAEGIVSSVPEAMVGASVAGPGDVNGDGFDDVLIGAPGDHDVEGDAAVFFGRVAGSVDLDHADILLDGPPDMRAGLSVAGPGDTNGDGYADLLVGGPGGDGAVWLVLGPASSHVDLDRADAVILGSTDATIGRRLHRVGDTDGDGHPDIGLSSGPATGPFGPCGEIFLFSSSTTGSVLVQDADVILSGTRHYEEAGTAVAALGDLDHDGFDDLLVSATDADPPRVFLVLGPPTTGGLYESWNVIDLPSGTRAGAAMATVTDFDDDGSDDLFVGGPSAHGALGVAWGVPSTALPTLP